MKNYHFKTISKQVLGDLHTPVSIYLKVRDIYPESALLESSDFHGNENSLSFIALCPLASIGINNGECTATFPDGNREVTPLSESYNVADAMNAFLDRYSIEGADKKVCRVRIHGLRCCPLLRKHSGHRSPSRRERCSRHAIHII